MDSCKGTNSINLDKEEFDVGAQDEEENYPGRESDVKLAQKLNGGLMWLATRTRPDIAYAVSRVGSAVTTHPKTAIVYGKKILRYLAASRKCGLVYEPRQDEDTDIMVETFADASLDDLRTTTGVVTYVGGALVDWRSTKQQVGAFSTCEAEVNALAMGEAMNGALVATIESMGRRCKAILYGDNQAANQISESRGTWKTRSLSVKVTAIRTRIRRGLLDLRYVGTKQQRADGLTKCGGVDHNRTMREHFNLKDI